VEQIQSALEHYGLSKTEAKVYLTCLTLGVSSVYKIAQRAYLPKSTCYDTLHALKQMGLVASVLKDKKTHFEAADPEKMISFLEEKKKNIQNILPQLQTMKKSAVFLPQVKVYSGKQGLKTIFDSVLTTKNQFLIIGNFTKFKEKLHLYSDIFVENRIKHGIFCKLIEEPSNKNIHLQKNDGKELRETKFCKGLKNLQAECLLFGDSVAFVALSEQEPVGILIKNKEINHLLRCLFSEMWKKNE